MQTVQEFYEQNVRSKPAAERLQLATLILNDIPPQAVTSDSEIWMEEDIELLPSSNIASLSAPLIEKEQPDSGDVGTDAEIVAAYCKATLDLKAANLGVEYGYGCLPFCIIDSVYSIGVRYEGVQNVIARYREYLGLLNIVEESHTIAELVELMQKHGADKCADNIFRNRQRTSARNGILKAEAVLLFADVLHKRGVNTREEAKSLTDDAEFEQEIFAIPGQGSGISLKYFFMLCGSSDYIKPDRMVFRFLEQVLGRRIGMEESVTLLRQAGRILQQEYPEITPRALDGEIWKYQRQQ